MYPVGEPFEFTLPDTDTGNELRTASDVAVGHDYALVVLLCSHYCPESRTVVQSLADGYERFADRSTAVVPVLPDSRERATVWERRYELPFELLADPGAEGEAADGDAANTDERNEFGAFASFERAVTELPGVVLFEVDDDRLRFVRTLDDDRFRDGSVVDGAVGAIDAHRTAAPDTPVEPGDDVNGLDGI